MPLPGNDAIGFTLFKYKPSRCPSFKETGTYSPSAESKYPTDVALLTKPRWKPAGANQGKATWSLYANVRNAMCDAGTKMFVPSVLVVNA